MHGGPPSEVVRHLYYYNTLEPGVQSAAPDDLHHHHPLPAVVAMDPSGGRDSRYNLNYSMSIGLNMAEGGGGGSGVQDMYGNPTSLVRPGMVMNNSRGLMGSNNNNNNNNNSSTSCLSNNSPVGGGGGGGGQSSGQRGIKRTNSDCFDDRAMGSNQQQQQLGSLSDGLSSGGGVGSGVVDVVDDSSYASSLQKKSPPANGKKTKGRVKIKMEYIDNKLRRYTTFSKRKTGIMKKVSFFVLIYLLFISF